MLLDSGGHEIERRRRYGFLRGPVEYSRVVTSHVVDANGDDLEAIGFGYPIDETDDDEETEDEGNE